MDVHIRRPQAKPEPEHEHEHEHEHELLIGDGARRWLQNGSAAPGRPPGRVGRRAACPITREDFEVTGDSSDAEIAEDGLDHPVNHTVTPSHRLPSGVQWP